MNFLKELYKTERGKALIKFSLYLLFLIFVIVLCSVAGSMKNDRTQTNPQSTEKESRISEKNPPTYFEKQKMLINQKYSFEYVITKTEKTVTYMGDFDGKNTNGYRETKDDLIHYVIEEGIPYKISLTEKTPLNDLFLDLNEKYFDLKNLFMTLNGLPAQIEKVDDDKIYNYELEDVNVTITVGTEYIKNIRIENENEKYDFSFYK